MLSEVGQLVAEEWIKTPLVRPNQNIKLDTFVIMPDHFHGIIIIGNNEHNRKMSAERIGISNTLAYQKFIGEVNPETQESQVKNQFGPQSNNLSSIIRGFKSAVTTRARISGNKEFQWQSRYHDKIIRDEREFFQKRLYILNNPIK
jgi:putative transposase